MKQPCQSTVKKCLKKGPSTCEMLCSWEKNKDCINVINQFLKAYAWHTSTMVVQWTRGLLSLETNSDLLGFVPATVSNTLEVEDKIFSSAAVSKHLLSSQWFEEINLNRNGKVSSKVKK